VGSNARPFARSLTGVVLRTAGTDDLADVVAMERACYSDPWSASSFAALPTDERVCFLVARDARTDCLLGFAVAWHVLDEGELANLAVAPESRGRGIGAALLDAVTTDALGRGTSQLYLEVRESNSAARRLYEAAGFHEIGRRKQYYMRPVEDALILRRTLTS
jgi:[ribosomal protein S18]-alanine N-acetyltransferase